MIHSLLRDQKPDIRRIYGPACFNNSKEQMRCPLLYNDKLCILKTKMSCNFLTSVSQLIATSQGISSQEDLLTFSEAPCQIEGQFWIGLDWNGLDWNFGKPV